MIDWINSFIYPQLNADVPKDLQTFQPLSYHSGSIGNSSKCLMAGWKFSYTWLLESAAVNISDPGTCRNHQGQIVSNTLCGRSNSTSVEACIVFSGAPFVCDGVQMGITSYHINCVHPRSQIIYTEVAQFYQWIDLNLR